MSEEVMKNRAKMLSWAYEHLGMPIVDDAEVVIWLHRSGLLLWCKKTGKGLIALGEEAIKLLLGKPACVGFSTKLLEGDDHD